MRPGDVAVILSGADVPTILRPVEGRFTMVGECYIEGATYGEFITAAAPSTLDGKANYAVKGQVFNTY